MTDRDLTTELASLLAPVWGLAHEEATPREWVRRWDNMGMRLWAYSEAVSVFGKPGTYSAMREDLALLYKIAKAHYDAGVARDGYPY